MKGLWLIREYLQGGIIDRQFACSNCDYTSGHVMTSWKYCPVCGSRNFLSVEEMKRENNPDCRKCDKWKTCENGEKGHANGTSIGYSIGECRDYVELKGE